MLGCRYPGNTPFPRESQKMRSRRIEGLPCHPRAPPWMLPFSTEAALCQLCASHSAGSASAPCCRPGALHPVLEGVAVLCTPSSTRADYALGHVLATV